MGYNPGFRDETAAATTGAEMLAVLQANDAHYVITPLEMAGAGTPLGDALTVGAEQVAVVNGAALFRVHE
jgi:hypothetical protein